MKTTWLSQITETLDERYKDGLRLADLALDVQRHPNYVSSEFRKRSGETLTASIRRRRITEARILLEGGSQTVAEIASELGFHDESHFARAFKRAVGSTPGHYRRRFRAAGRSVR